MNNQIHQSKLFRVNITKGEGSEISTLMNGGISLDSNLMQWLHEMKVAETAEERLKVSSESTYKVIIEGREGQSALDLFEKLRQGKTSAEETKRAEPLVLTVKITKNYSES